MNSWKQDTVADDSYRSSSEVGLKDTLGKLLLHVFKCLVHFYYNQFQLTIKALFCLPQVALMLKDHIPAKAGA